MRLRATIKPPPPSPAASGDAYSQVREGAAAALGQAAAKGDEQATASLARALSGDAYSQVRFSAAIALAQVAVQGDEQATASLAHALAKDGD